MDIPPPNARRFPQARPTGHVVLATIAPMLVAVYAANTVLAVDEHYGLGAVAFVLFGWCVVLLASAFWLNRILFNCRRSFLPLLAALCVIPLIWLWQRLAFNAFIPHAQLTYGYFLHPEGAKARFWVLSCPLWVGLTCLAICFVATLILGWRAGARYSLACLLPWWIATLFVFMLPSVYLDGQGNASIFI